MSQQQIERPNSRPGSKELRTSKENFQNRSALKINQVVPEDKITKATAPAPQQAPVTQAKPSIFFVDDDKLSRLEKYEENDMHDPLNKPFIPYQGFKGPKQDRVSTDKGWTYFFLLIYLIFGFYAYFVLAWGDTRRLANGMDFRGKVCGYGSLKTRPYLYWAQPLMDENVAWCVRQCPPSTGRDICMYDVDNQTPTPFCYVQMQADQLGRYCIPKEPANRGLVMDELGTFRNQVRRISADLFLCWDIVLIAVALCILLSYIFTLLATFKCIVSGLIWSGIGGSVIAFGVFAWLSWLEAARTKEFRCFDGTNPDTCGGQRQAFFEIMTFVIGGVGVVYLFVIVLLYRRINRGSQLIQKAQHIIEVLSQIRIFPFVVSFVGLCVCGLVFWLIVNAMTVGDLELTRAQNIDGHLLWKLYYNDNIQYMILYALFVLVFTMVLILVMNDMLTSYALSVWFFTKQKDTVRIPLWFVVKTLYRYHFGTCVFITFNLIFLSLPKLLMTMMRTSNCVRYSQACFMGCVHVYETFLRYISKHTVVQVAVWSEPYQACAKRSYFLLFRNASKIKDLDFIQALVVFQLQLCTSLVAAIPVYIYVANAELTPYGNLTKDIETPIIPTTFVFLIGLFFTAIFQGGYDITCKTIIQLYLMDNEMFFGEQRFVEDFIREFMEFVGKEEEEEYKIGFTRQVKIDEEKLKQDDDDDDDKPRAKNSDDEDEDEDEEEEEDEKYSEQYVNYEEQEERKNAFTGLPIDDTIKPSGQNKQRVQEELSNITTTKKTHNYGPKVYSGVAGDQTLNVNPNNGTRTDALDTTKQQKLNTSSQSFKQFAGMGDVSNISDVSVGEPKKEKKQLKF